MPAEAFGVMHSATHPARDQRRRSARRACSLDVTVRTGDGDYSATLNELSAGGMGLRIGALMALKPGTQLLIAHPQLGEVPCVLRWAMHPRYGAEFQASSQTLARALALYDTLPPAPDEII
ncbi:MAG: PilZ domain-containing protein [Alphaproteobacteria bacterium]|nr:PilZ domain-containing protein [Alphaproteobacteria bacterium]